MRYRSSVCHGLILLICLSTVACAGSLFHNYGGFSPKEEVTQAFEGYRTNPDFRYYISGSDLYPNALMGLHRDYRLDPSTLWKEVRMSDARMKEIVENMKTKAGERGAFQHGFELLDPKEAPIGVWYSILTAKTFIHMNDDGTVRIDTPALDTYEAQGRDSVKSAGDLSQ